MRILSSFTVGCCIFWDWILSCHHSSALNGKRLCRKPSGPPRVENAPHGCYTFKWVTLAKDLPTLGLKVLGPKLIFVLGAGFKRRAVCLAFVVFCLLLSLYTCVFYHWSAIPCSAHRTSETILCLWVTAPTTVRSTRPVVSSIFYVHPISPLFGEDFQFD